ncbi:Mur ligase family protein [Actibacterium pelagium]|uniref:Mur ligase n=1 Tax=Actibacterium pelagium TaxID=2029103 RepID=A0A917ADW9_9RHOB|nr:UDP-N-acetylmuramoyl-tripeptide--D-alanyl-D-alanine ligase [Actibacterium pelagium]GGE41488.1 Mur ligase [Actibacterium pelagium]
MTALAGLLVLVSLAALLWQRQHTLLTYFQQEEYDNTRFFTAWQNVRLFDLRATATIVVALVVIAAGAPFVGVKLALAAALAGIMLIERRYRFKKPLAMTERAKRLLYLSFALTLVLALLTVVHPLWAIVALQLAPVTLVLANMALKPLQTRVNEGYTDQAKAKLARLDPVRIGITGSFGKTTVKHMLAEILEASGSVFYSPGSINTVLGHTRHIRQRLQWSHKYFIAEMGAYGIGSIKRLCDFIHPTYGIVTAIGDAHTERFGSIEAIAQAKSELAEEACLAGGTVVVNIDVMQYEPFQRLKKIYDLRMITVGAEGSDVVVDAQETDGASWRISLHSKLGLIPDVTYDLPLLGAHNVTNSALAVTLSLVIDPEIADQIPYFTKTIAQVPHRLQVLDTPGSALILDDAYNSNEQGFMSAVASMDKLAKKRGGRRILVTPGIAELGLEHDRVHARLGEFCSDRCDTVYVINPSRIPSFAETIDADKVTVVEVPSFAAARAAIAKDLKQKDVVLYENDLPDLLEEKRLL